MGEITHTQLNPTFHLTNSPHGAQRFPAQNEPQLKQRGPAPFLSSCTHVPHTLTLTTRSDDALSGQEGRDPSCTSLSHNPGNWSSPEKENGSSGNKAEVGQEGAPKVHSRPENQGIYYHLPVLRSHSATPRHIPTRKERLCLPQDVYKNTPSSSVHYGPPTGETPHTSSGRKVNELELLIRVTT